MKFLSKFTPDQKIYIKAFLKRMSERHINVNAVKKMNNCWIGQDECVYVQLHGIYKNPVNLSDLGFSFN